MYLRPRSEQCPAPESRPARKAKSQAASERPMLSIQALISGGQTLMCRRTCVVRAQIPRHPLASAQASSPELGQWQEPHGREEECEARA